MYIEVILVLRWTAYVSIFVSLFNSSLEKFCKRHIKLKYAQILFLTTEFRYIFRFSKKWLLNFNLFRFTDT